MKLFAPPITKHTTTHCPWLCAHCGLMWYGYAFQNEWMNMSILCNECENAFMVYASQQDDLPTDDEKLVRMEKFQRMAKAWIDNPNYPPYPYIAEDRFHPSVPAWMRNAIKQGMITPGENRIWYTVYSQGDCIIKVESCETRG